MVCSLISERTNDLLIAVVSLLQMSYDYCLVRELSFEQQNTVSFAFYSQCNIV